ncbi:MAG: hypothetical protein E8D40_13255 [Nitrospira sp.]|nr:MAG: hypothetical protein E8D40_13255 [Nitrospira sp.]
MNWQLFMRNVALTLIIAQFCLAGAVIAAQLCEDKDRFVGACFTVHGRLLVSNGTSSVRLIPKGSKLQLGVVNDGDAEDHALPGEIAKVISTETRIYGKFEVCPLTESKPHEMQIVCVISGKSLIARKIQ